MNIESQTMCTYKYFTAMFSTHGVEFHHAAKLQYKTVPVFKASIYSKMKKSLLLCEDLPVAAGIFRDSPLMPGGI